MSAVEPCTEPFGGGTRCRACEHQRTVAGLRTCSFVEVRSAAMRALMRRARAVAQSGAPVVLLGETGTGKEVLARALHHGSPRADGPFVPVNCGAIPGELLESELFGHVRGAFSGAVSEKAGLFEAASGGTLLLDEVGDLPLPLQVKLLRALQDGEVRRVGANRAVAVDVRVIAATHQDLERQVAAGRFRADLYYRVKVHALHLPALRERGEDILPLARHFLAQEASPPRQLSPAAEDLLLAYRWPGNVRELSNAMRCAAGLAEGPVIGVEDLPEEVVRGRAGPGAPAGPLRSLAQVEREHVLSVLHACGGVQADAARILGIGRNTLWRKLRTWLEAVPGDPLVAEGHGAPGPGAADGPGPEPGGLDGAVGQS